ncbi:hypothetical protein BDV25DRAFT_131807 [Aspergillus avenaceus]|uniref:Uncharacterized protein n=1 Tax=Aspergillus avenaceus TaxID=36643 RepID=A0A5N6TN39_ASPAV|nr:hypothetical protein BDV25DRAFT_131807 [Aspergillus avenaceus]
MEKKHWSTTLLGPAFWQDAEQFNQPIHDAIEAEAVETNKPLHRRFPFSIGRESTPQIISGDPEPSKEEGMKPPRPKSHMYPRSQPLQAPHSRSKSQPQFSLPFPRRSRSSTRSSSSGQDTALETPVKSRSRALFRPLGNFLRGISRSRRRDLIPDDQATFARPLLEFKGDEDTWARLDEKRVTLGLDLFWPIQFDTTPALPSLPFANEPATEPANQQENENDDDEEIFPIESLRPLIHFRSLRSLKLTGMMTSYQKYIWQAAWLNPYLDELELGMALGPSLRRPYATTWPCIQGGWELSAGGWIREPVYFGTQGTGHLHPTIGVGEYLDKYAIETAKVTAMATGRTRQKLSIRTLVLSGFVVDGDPFLQWFDAQRLKCVRFRDECVDAGFWLGGAMAGVGVVWPREEERVILGRWVDCGEGRVVDL